MSYCKTPDAERIHLYVTSWDTTNKQLNQKQLFTFEGGIENWANLSGDINAATPPVQDTGTYKVGSNSLKLTIDVGEDAGHAATFESTEAQGDLQTYSGLATGAATKGILSFAFYRPTTITNLTNFSIYIGDGTNYQYYTITYSDLIEGWNWIMIDLTQPTGSSGTVASLDWTAIDSIKLETTHLVGQGDYNLYIDQFTIADSKNFSNNLIKLNYKHRQNSVDSFNGALVGITSAEDKAYINKGSAVIAVVGNTLHGRGILEQPAFNADYTVEFDGFGSTGSVGAGRKLRKENTNSTTEYTATATNTVLLAIAPTTVTHIDATDDGSSLPINIKLNYDNRLKEVKRLSGLSSQEWWFEYSACDDILHMGTKGSGSDGSTRITYAISGASQNASGVSVNEESETMCNQAIILGSGKGTEQMKSDVYNASGVYSPLNKTLDTRLTNAISNSATSLTVKHSQANTQMPTGTFCIKIDEEIMTLAAGKYSTTTMTVTRGQGSTNAVAHDANADVIFWRNTDIATPATSEVDIDIDSGTSFTGVTKVRCGSEIINVGSLSSNTLQNCTRSAAGTTWAHEDNINVYLYQDGSGPYTITAPKTGSPIDKYGIQSKVFNESSARHPSDLDRKGQKILAEKEEPPSQIIVVPSDLYGSLDTNTNAPIVVGDWVTISDAETNLNMTAGASDDFRVYASNLIHDYGLQRVEYEVSNQRLNYSEEVVEGIGVDYQRPAREVAEALDSYLEDSKTYTRSGYSTLSGGTLLKSKVNQSIILDSGKYIILDAENDVHVRLADAGGANQFYIRDSNDAPLFTVNSAGATAVNSGNLSVSGNITGADNLTLDSGGTITIGNQTIEDDSNDIKLTADDDIRLTSGDDIRLTSGDDIVLEPDGTIVLDCGEDILLQPGSSDDAIWLYGELRILDIKSGATQGAAGASIHELWKTNGHATLPDNVVMIGV